MKNVYLLLFIVLFSGCYSRNQSSSDDLLMQNLDSKIVSSAEVKKLCAGNPIVSYDTLYPISVECYDTLLYVVLAKVDKLLDVRNRNSGHRENIMGNKGYGPDDVLTLDLMINSNDLKAEYGGVVYYDLGRKRILLAKGKEDLSAIAAMSDSIYPSSEVGIGKNYKIARKIDARTDALCQIYDLPAGATRVIKAYPEIKDLSGRINRNYLYSSKMAYNEQKKRIVFGMFFWDLIQVYDLNGHRIKAFSLAKDFNAERSMKNMFEGADYIGFNQIYATSEHCYLRRVFTEGKTRHARRMQILKTDWDGNVRAIYSIDEPMVGNFTVDEEKGEIIGIVQQAGKDIEEYYNVVSYKM